MKPLRFWSVACIALLFTGYIFYRSATMAHTHQVSYDTYLSVMLTALGVILAALALFVGAAAIWGYQQISSQAESRADKAATKRVEELLAESNINETIQQRVRAEADLVYEDLASSTSAGTDTKAVAKAYPGTSNVS